MSSEFSSPSEQSEESVELALRKPSNYRILLHNDDYTTMEFVMDILIEFFQKSTEEAYDIMIVVHEKGIGSCGVYTEEVAETKVSQVHEKARRAGFPLRCSMEEE